jgi:hypothetical protein
MTSVLEALVDIVAGAWTAALRGKARRLTIGILVLAPIIILAVIYVLSG